MQYFQDSTSGSVYAFELDVVATMAFGVYTFATADGTQLSGIPTTLHPCLVPTPPTPTVSTRVSPGVFFSRFASGEQLVIQTLATTNAGVALGLTKAIMLGYVDVSSADVSAWMALLVANSAITPTRSAQIVDLSAPSP